MQELIAFFLILGAGVAAFPKQVGAAFTAIRPQAVNEIDKRVLAQTMWGEARGEGYAGMQAVANVVMNRFKIAADSPAKARQFGRTIEEICKKPYQFSAWNSNDPNFSKMINLSENDPQFRDALEIAERALRGTLPDITGGADHYHTYNVSPSWSQGETVIAQIGSHNFFKIG